MDAQTTTQDPQSEIPDTPHSRVPAVEKLALRVIEARSHQREEAAQTGKPADAAADRAHAQADARDFAKLRDESMQETAAVVVADNTRKSPEYKAALDSATPELAAQIYAIDQANTAKLIERAQRKAEEARAMQQEREATAKAWTPEEAAKQAMADAQAYRDKPAHERGHARDDMTLNSAANPVYAETLEKTDPGLVAEIKGEQRETMVLDPQALARVAAARARDSERAREELRGEVTPNSIESAGKAPGQTQQKEQPRRGDNQVESDEILTATQPDPRPVVPPEVSRQYLRVGDKFHDPVKTNEVVFEDKGNRLETKSNSETVAENMVRIAEARGWDEIKVAGSETFRREAWLEAAQRGMTVKGYTPSEVDLAQLEHRKLDAQSIKITATPPGVRSRDDTPTTAPDPKTEAKADKPDAALTPAQKMAQTFRTESPEAAAKQHPELAGTAAALAAVEKKVGADRLNAQQREIVMSRVQEVFANSIENGNVPAVKLREQREISREAKQSRGVSR